MRDEGNAPQARPQWIFALIEMFSGALLLRKQYDLVANFKIEILKYKLDREKCQYESEHCGQKKSNTRDLNLDHENVRKQADLVNRMASNKRHRHFTDAMEEGFSGLLRHADYEINYIEHMVRLQYYQDVLKSNAFPHMAR